MNAEELRLERQGFIATLTLNRPEKRNALTPDLLGRLSDLLEDLGKTDEVRTVILTGAGEKAFSAGYDVTAFPRPSEKDESMEPVSSPLEQAIQAIMAYPYPVVGRLNGHAIGAGCELALACDLRVAAEDCRLGLPPARLGIIYPLPGVLRIVGKVGLQAAKELFFTARLLDPDRVRELRLVDYQVARGDLTGFTHELAAEIAANAPLSLKGTKFMMRAIENSRRLSEADTAMIETMTRQAYNSEDHQEGLSAFWEKRRPAFKGR